MKFFILWAMKKLRKLVMLAEHTDENLILMFERMDSSMATFGEALNDLTLKVAGIEDSVGVAVVQIEDLAAAIRGNVNDPQALLALADRLDVAKVTLDDAVAANPVPEPPVVP
jgi:hypothetical protein